MHKPILAEVFGFPVNNLSDKAERYRKNKLCPHNNRVANCTKDKANDPLGVCSIFDTSGNIAITCPVRFRQDWHIAEDAANFFFPNSLWTSLTEVRLNDSYGISAGNIDIVIVSYDERGKILDFGSLEIQAVYISGNVRTLFDQYMFNPDEFISGAIANKGNRPRPDYLSSSRKRLLPQLLYKGTILQSWGKKQAVALHRAFYETLPVFQEVDPSEAEMAWLIYDLRYNDLTNAFDLVLHRIVYTLFASALQQISTPSPGAIQDFVAHLQGKLDEKLDQEHNAPDAPTLDQLL